MDYPLKKEKRRFLVKENLSEVDEVPKDVEKLFQKILFDNPNLKEQIEINRIAIETKKKEYNQRPEVKARQKKWVKEYNQRPEVKAKRRAYARKYSRRPEVKARRRERYLRPDVNKKIKERQRKYYQRKIKSFKNHLNKAKTKERR